MVNQLKSIYNSPFKSSHSHPIHTCLSTIASNDYITFLKRQVSVSLSSNSTKPDGFYSFLATTTPSLPYKDNCLQSP